MSGKGPSPREGAVYRLGMGDAIPARGPVGRRGYDVAVERPDPERHVARSLAAVVPEGAPVLLAVSGGSDSMALLAAAARVARERVAVVHVDHGLRAGSGGDARFVADRCAELGVPCDVVRVAPRAGSSGRTETAARGLRLGALAEVAAARGAGWVLTAHHRDDAHETLLLHLARGHRGDRALASIPAVRPLGGDARVLHPFLVGDPRPGRDALAAWREARGVPHVEDPTNADDRVPRNAMRRALAAGDAPLDAETLEGLRRRARRRLERRLLAVAARLAGGWRAEGRGSFVERAVLEPPEGDVAEAWIPELLRLLGAGLARPRRLAPRASVVAPLTRLLERGRGELAVPAGAAPLRLRASRAGLHLPDEPPRPGDPAARVLDALTRTSLHL